MALSVNKVTLLGNIGKDLDYKVTPSGIPLCKFSLATSESYKDKETDEWKSISEWHNIECWRYVAETANKHLHKGSKVYIEGKLKTEKYEKDGITQYRTKVVATEIVVLEKTNNENQQTKTNDDMQPQFGENVVNEIQTDDYDEVPF